MRESISEDLNSIIRRKGA
jgi:hypothetical protein